MKILNLKSENVKRIIAAEITPQGNVVVVGGSNGAGKSSLIDSIFYALGGASALPQVPVRKGEERAIIELDLGDKGVELVVRRVCTATGGTSLVVTGKDGVRFQSPQAVLDALVKNLTFDPLDFSRQKPLEQVETLRNMAGLDFSKIETEEASARNNRTLLGREVKSLESQFAAAPFTPDAPETETSTADIMEEMRKASEKNTQNAEMRSKLASVQSALESAEIAFNGAKNRVASLKDQIAELQSRLISAQITEGDLHGKLEAAKVAVEAKRQELSELRDEDLTPFKSKIQNAETINRQVRQNAKRKELEASLSAKRAEHTASERKIESLEQDKKKLVQNAKLPIQGLSFEAGQVLFNGIPLSQISSAEQLKISVAVGMSLNPKLKVLLIRDGSLLDESNLKLLTEMADTENCQIWLERVSTGSEVSVIIEDGRVKGAPVASATTQPELTSAAPTTEPAPKKKPAKEKFVPSEADLIP
jgi:DNA repair exonuclease SbcCD ATPase subunit